MPEYLAPGVYVEETSFRAKSIEGVSTTTTGFIGPTRYGPLDIEPDIITSLVEFERTYGGKERLEFDDGQGNITAIDNYMWHAARAFFEEGGKRLYVSRVYSGIGSPEVLGYSHARIDASPGINVRARFPGRAGDARVTFTFNVGQNVLVDEDPANPGFQPGVRSLRDRDVVMILDRSVSGSPPTTTLISRGFFLALRDVEQNTWNFSPSGVVGASPQLELEADLADPDIEIRVVTVAVSVAPVSDGLPYDERDLPLDPDHRLGDSPDSLFDAFAPHTRDPQQPHAKVIANLGRARTVPIVIESGFVDGLQVLTAFLNHSGSQSPGRLEHGIETVGSSVADRTLSIMLGNGNDGVRPLASAYEGHVDAISDLKTGLMQFEDLEDISIVAAPGSTYQFENGYGPQARAIVGLLLAHAAKMRYRIAVIDCGDNQSISQVRAMRASFDSTYVFGLLRGPAARVCSVRLSRVSPFSRLARRWC